MDLPDFFGVDIGSQAIKVAQVKRSGDKAKLIKLAKIDTPDGLVENESDEGIEQLATKILEVRENAGIKTKNFIAAVPEPSVFSRLITVPKVEPKQLEQTVHWEIKPMLPVALEDVDIAFLDIGEKELKGQKYIDIYAVAAPKTLTDRYRAIAEKAGLELIALETESLAMTRSVIFSQKPVSSDVVIIDFGADSTNIVLSRNSVVVFSQTSTTGSDALTKAIAADYGIDMVEAEKYKRAFGIQFDQGGGKIAKSIEPIMQILLTDVVRAINYFKDRVGGNIAQSVYLTGDGAKLLGLVPYLQEKINLQTQIADSFSNFELDGGVSKEIGQHSGSGFTVALGLALKDAEN